MPCQEANRLGINAAFDQLGTKGVASRMRIHFLGQLGLFAVFIQDFVDRQSRKRSPLSNEQFIRIRVWTHIKICLNCIHRCGIQVHFSRLVPFAVANEDIAEIVLAVTFCQNNVIQFNVDKLRTPDSRSE